MIPAFHMDIFTGRYNSPVVGWVKWKCVMIVGLEMIVPGYDIVFLRLQKTDILQWNVQLRKNSSAVNVRKPSIRKGPNLSALMMTWLVRDQAYCICISTCCCTCTYTYVLGISILGMISYNIEVFPFLWDVTPQYWISNYSMRYILYYTKIGKILYTF